MDISGEVCIIVYHCDDTQMLVPVERNKNKTYQRKKTLTCYFDIIPVFLNRCI